MAEVSFGEWLKRRRGAKGWTQKQLSQQINCSVSALRKMEAEERRPSAQVIQQLAEIFEIPLDERKSFMLFARGDWQAISSGETEEAPWRVSQLAPRTNLPVSISSFIGRKKEQAEIIALLAKHRLVTIAGTGGIGKTRLALQVGKELLKDYPNAVWFVAFDSLSDPTLVPATVAAVFDIREGSSSQPLLDRLIYSLRAKTTLLVLDNCEHLLDACAQLITTLLTHCPNLKVLATSREVLGLEGEAVYYLPSLSIPATQHIGPTENLSQYESVQLFIQRAQLAQTHFSMTTENASFLVQICQLLDGIPLALELAAAHVDILQLREIWKQLKEHFDLLASHLRAAIPRHQTMRTSLDWSWGLLSNEEQTCMGQLSVFAGGWTLDSAQAVCEGNTLNLISSLVKKSLIMAHQESGRETRFRFHEILSQYGHEKLLEAGEEENIRTRHLNYFLELSEQAEPALRGPAQIEWMARLNDERDNIRAALTWADQRDVEAGLYLASRLGRFWESFDLREESDWLSTFLQKPESHSYPKARAMALHSHISVLNDLDQVDLCQSTAKECLELYHTLGDQLGEVDVVIITAGGISNAEQRMELFQQALHFAQASGDIWRQARALHLAGWNCNGDEKFAYWKRAIKLFRQAGDWRSLAQCLSSTGNFALLDGNLKLAQESLQEATALSEKLKDKSVRADILFSSGRVAMRTGDYDQAHLHLQEAVEIMEELGVRLSSLFTRTQLGYLALREGNLTEAYHVFSETIQNFQKGHNLVGAAFTAEGMAGVDVARDQPTIAARLIGWADAARRQINDTRPRLEQADVDKIIAACLAKMGEVAFSDAYEEGQKMSLDEAVAYALNEN